jgi:hypothetical protein
MASSLFFNVVQISSGSSSSSSSFSLKPVARPVVLCRRAQTLVKDKTVGEMWTRLVFLMFWPFGNDECILMHKVICQANTTDKSWEAFLHGKTTPASTANAMYWSNATQHGLRLLQDVHPNGEITIDYGEYALPMEERLSERKKHMSPEIVAILLAVARWISPKLEEKIKCT